MATDVLTPQTNPSEIHETVVEFPDNLLLIDLCGEYDRNIAEVEKSLAVQILRRGNVLTIIGDPDASAIAKDVLHSLYQRLEQGRSVEHGDVDRELRMVGVSANVTDPDDQMEMFSGDRFEIKTRKKPVEPRTDAQKAYVKSLFTNDLAF
ncbi:MAG: phosphate starvation-inducible protein PhoH, partial [Pseudomonadota bacterium]